MKHDLIAVTDFGGQYAHLVATTEARVFPAINIRTSGTRREELLYIEDQITALNLLGKRAIAVPPRQAMEGMLKLMEKYPSNDALLAGLKSLTGV